MLNNGNIINTKNLINLTLKMVNDIFVNYGTFLMSTPKNPNVI